MQIKNLVSVVSGRRTWTVVVLGLLIFLAVQWFRLLLSWTLPGGLWALLCILIPLYLASQALRALRLFLLCYDRRIRFSQLCWVHIFTVAVSQLIPFKLGELIRIALIGRLLASPTRAVLAVWSERIYDVTVVVCLVLALGLLNGQGWAVSAFEVLTFVFLFLSFFVFLVLPENVSMLKRYLLLRTSGPKSLALMHMADRLHGVVQMAGAMWRSHWATVSWLTVGIWGLEVTWMYMLVVYVDSGSVAGLVELFKATAIQSVFWAEDGDDLPSLSVQVAMVVMVHAMLAWGLIAGVLIWLKNYLGAVPDHNRSVK